MRFLVPVALICLLAACGGGSDGQTAGSPATQPGARLPVWVKTALSEKAGPDVAVTMGSSDFVVGENRVVFLVVRENGQLVRAPRAQVRFGAEGGKPVSAEAELESLGAQEHGDEQEDSGDHLDVTEVYVAHVQTPRAGKYWFVVDPAGEDIQAVGTLDVAARSATPAVGAKAPASDNPTLADAPAEEITTARPPDTELLRHSIADSLREHVPFVAVFATPAYCVSRVCGPTLEAVEKVANRYAGDGIRFIHVEIYADNEPDKGYNRWVRQWNLPTEPWVFLADASGVIRAKFEGAVSVDELSSAVAGELGAEASG